MSNKKSLVQQTADNIYTLIVVKKEFKPGEQLPNENALAELLGVGRSTLREAVRILVSQGILTVQRGKGTFVSAEVNSYSDLELESMDRIRARLKDLFETRLIFEPSIAAMACKRATDEELETILKIGKEEEKIIADGKNHTEIDFEFHRAIVIASHNDFLQKLLPIINNAISDAVALNPYCNPLESNVLADNTAKDHARLMEFLKDRDSDGAKNAMLIHLHHGIKNMGLNTGDEPIF